MAQRKTDKQPVSLNYNDMCSTCVFVDKMEYKITLKFLEQILEKARKAGKTPNLTLGIKKNEGEMVILKCLISVEKKGNK